MEAYVGEIRAWACNFAPRQWLPCNGQILPIASNTALFSILGTAYGGNGTTNFALPNLNGRVTVNAGQGPALSDWVVGEAQGSPSVTLTMQEMPMHNHFAGTKNQTGGMAPIGPTPSPQTYLDRLTIPDGSTNKTATAWFTAPATTPTQLNPMTVGPTGGGGAHENQQPYLAMIWAIATTGIFPSRN